MFDQTELIQSGLVFILNQCDYEHIRLHVNKANVELKWHRIKKLMKVIICFIYRKLQPDFNLLLAAGALKRPNIIYRRFSIHVLIIWIFPLVDFLLTLRL